MTIMKNALRLATAFLMIVALNVATKATQPIVVPFTVPTSTITVKVTVDGYERTLALSTSTPSAYLSGTAIERLSVKVGGESLGKVRFAPVDQPTAGALGGDGALGMETLGATAVGIDILGNKATIWPGGKLDSTTVSSWMTGSPEWDGLRRVRRIPLRRLPGGAPAVEAMIGGVKVPLLLRLGFFASGLEPSVKRPAIPIGDDGFSLLPSLSVDGLDFGALVYAPSPEGTFDPKQIGTPGGITLDAFPSRRVVVDFAGGAMYVEDLPADARLTLLMHRQTRFPFKVEGDRILVAPIPGHEGESALRPYFGGEAVNIAGQSPADWLKDLRGRDEASARSLAARIARIREGFAVLVRMPDGREVPINFHIPTKAAPL